MKPKRLDSEKIFHGKVAPLEAGVSGTQTIDLLGYNSHMKILHAAVEPLI